MAKDVRSTQFKKGVLLLLLRSNVGMGMSNLEVDILDKLGRSLKFLTACPGSQPQACSFECVGWTGLQNVVWLLDTSSSRALVCGRQPEAVHM